MELLGRLRHVSWLEDASPPPTPPGIGMPPELPKLSDWGLAYHLGRLSTIEDSKKRKAAIGKIKVADDSADLKKLLKLALDGASTPKELLAEQDTQKKDEPGSPAAASAKASQHSGERNRKECIQPNVPTVKIAPDYATAGSRAKFPNSDYTACVHDVAVGNLDMCVADLWLTPERNQLATFLPALRQDFFYLVVPQKIEEVTFWSRLIRPFMPFTGDGWLGIGAFLCSMATLLWSLAGRTFILINTHTRILHVVENGWDGCFFGVVGWIRFQFAIWHDFLLGGGCLAWHFVTFQRVSRRVESRFVWQAQYFRDVFKKLTCIFRGRRSTLDTFIVIFRGRRSTLDVWSCVFFANRIVRAASSGEDVQIVWQAWHLLTRAVETPLSMGEAAKVMIFWTVATSLSMGEAAKVMVYGMKIG
eukprot:s344_g21.t1